MSKNMQGPCFMLGLLMLFVTTNLQYCKGDADNTNDANWGKVDLPEGHPQLCKILFKDGAKMYTLGVLPGIGWDNIRNVFMDKVLEYQYRTCTMTEDEMYLIPDGIYTIPTKESKIQLSTEIYEDWTNYTSAISASVNVAASYSNIIKSVSGSFSVEVQKNKQRQVFGGSYTTRVQLRHRLYKVVMGSGISVSEEFKTRVIQIGNNLANDDKVMAEYLSDTLVRDYGTHIITRLDAGAILTQESQIKKTEVTNMKADSLALKASAKISFLRGKIGLSAEVAGMVKDESNMKFVSKLTDSQIESYGGPVFTSNMTVNDWERHILQNLIAIDKAGEPLQNMISEVYISNLPPMLIRQVSDEVNMAIYRYYRFNLLRGCTNSSSPNFNFMANTAQNDLCVTETESSRSRYKVGGVFQSCTTSVPESKICNGKNTKNPYTGTAGCPRGFDQYLISMQRITKLYTAEVSMKTCTRYGWMKKKTRCMTVIMEVMKMASAWIRSYWCGAVDTKSTLGDYYFGGIYTVPKVPNPFTGTLNCPQHFMSLSLGNGVKICISNVQKAIPFKVEFGGIFTCKIGNKFVNGKNPSEYLQKCPEKYTSYLATVTDDACVLNYCVHSAGRRSVARGGELPVAIRPPYTTKPMRSPNATNTMAIIDDVTGITWIKNEETGEWSKYGMEDEMPPPPNFLRDSNNVDSPQVSSSSVNVTSSKIGLTSLVYILTLFILYT